eukprot:8536445-Alexandrium_andersonii.AAC.1
MFKKIFGQFTADFMSSEEFKQATGRASRVGDDMSAVLGILKLFTPKNTLNPITATAKAAIANDAEAKNVQQVFNPDRCTFWGMAPNKSFICLDRL